MLVSLEELAKEMDTENKQTQNTEKKEKKKDTIKKPTLKFTKQPRKKLPTAKQVKDVIEINKLIQDPLNAMPLELTDGIKNTAFSVLSYPAKNPKRLENKLQNSKYLDEYIKRYVGDVIPFDHHSKACLTYLSLLGQDYFDDMINNDIEFQKSIEPKNNISTNNINKDDGNTTITDFSNIINF